MLTFRCAAETNSNRWIQMMMLIWWCVRLELHELTLSKAKLFFELNVELNTISFKKNLCTFNPLIFTLLAGEEGDRIKACLLSGKLAEYPQLLNQLLAKAGLFVTSPKVSSETEVTSRCGHFLWVMGQRITQWNHREWPFLFCFANSFVSLIMGKGRPIKKVDDFVWTRCTHRILGQNRPTNIYLHEDF